LRWRRGCIPWRLTLISGRYRERAEREREGERGREREREEEKGEKNG
jgi:hypothetical protein